ncbi:MAG: hypothetical protein NTW03_14875, partial [Verrucomicrobia bacterium]|nr:hypothetical protein [Verrucomicrobiota bacterium]
SPTSKTTSFERKTYTLETCAQTLHNLKPAEEKDRGLWEYRLSAAAMRQGSYAEAKQQLDDVLPKVGAIMAKTKDAAKARSVFHEEAKKTFLGEPYERVMAYYYRGILYWMDGEVDNARACFLSAQFHDSFAVETNYICDYALLDFLDGLAMAKLGNDASDALKRAQEHDIHKALPPFDPKANVLVFLQIGDGPIKYCAGQYHEQLRFASANARIHETYVGRRLTQKVVSDPRPNAFPSAKLTVNGQEAVINIADDLFFQATTRGGRVMDHVLANKAVFKKTTDKIGDVALIAGVGVASAALASGNRNAGIAGAGILLIGLAAKGIAAAANPTADTRCWDNLPQYLGLATLQLPAGRHEAVITFLDSSGGILNKKTTNIEVADLKKDTVVFVSDH